MTTEKTAARARTILATISLLGVAILGTAAVLAVMLVREAMAREGASWIDGLYAAALPMGIGAVGLILAAMPWGVRAMVNVLAQRAVDDRWRYEQIVGALEAQRQMLETLRETASLSDAARQVAYRQKDRQAIRDAVRDDMERGDFDAALALVEVMEERFGYRKEAEALRQQIKDAAHHATEQEVSETIDAINVLIKNYDWNEAFKAYDRLARRFGDHPDVRGIPERIQNACNAHKRELLNQWQDAVARDDVDRSIALLKELDLYLTPSEGEAYKEMARDVFRKRLQQMGVQFALHVHDRNWREALRIGRQIADEFPNTRMAAEVKEKLPILEEKARGNEPAAV